MKTIFLTIICLSIFSCNEKKKNNLSSENNLPRIMDITNYTGNAIAFYRDGIWGGDPSRFTMQLITIEESDSNIFKQDTFDINKHVQGRPSLLFSNGTEIYNLYKSEHKKKYDLNICNVNKKNNSYIKLWISYQNYEDISKAKGKVITTDSCSVREIFIGHNGKLNEFKILSAP